jgi:hypothetical protein
VFKRLRRYAVSSCEIVAMQVKGNKVRATRSRRDNREVMRCATSHTQPATRPVCLALERVGTSFSLSIEDRRSQSEQDYFFVVPEPNLFKIEAQGRLGQRW